MGKVEATLSVMGPNNFEENFTLSDGASITIGSDASCGVVLESPRVAPRHCVLHFESGNLAVTDWYTEAGTFVNGEKIYTETRLHEGDQLRVGQWEMRFCLGPGRDTERDQQTQSLYRFIDERAEQPAPIEELENVAVPDAADEPDALMLGIQMDELLAENMALKRELEYQKTLAGVRSESSSPWEEPDESESAQLRAEIEFLQSEMQRKEQEIEQLLGGEPASQTPSGTFDTHETIRLVNRLEELMEELKLSDDRIRDLEGLVQASDEAAMAEKAEREQLGGWVSEIEARIADREAGWRAAEERLKAQLEEATRRYERAEEQLAKALASHVTEVHAAMQRDLADLRDRNRIIVKELMQTRSDYHELAGLVRKTGLSESDIRDMNTRQAAIREQEIQIAQERAAIARERAEIANQREEVARSESRTEAPSISNPDQRIRLFREHLREIHDSEKEEKRNRGLSSRIARLFRRLEDH